MNASEAYQDQFPENIDRIEVLHDSMLKLLGTYRIIEKNAATFKKSQLTGLIDI